MIMPSADEIAIIIQRHLMIAIVLYETVKSILQVWMIHLHKLLNTYHMYCKFVFF